MSYSLFAILNLRCTFHFRKWRENLSVIQVAIVSLPFLPPSSPTAGISVQTASQGGHKLRLPPSTALPPRKPPSPTPSQDAQHLHLAVSMQQKDLSETSFPVEQAQTSINEEVDFVFSIYIR